MELGEILKPYGYAEAHAVSSRTSIAELFPPGQRCGVYVLEFSNGDVYVGKTKQIARRFGQHRNAHGDIQSLRLRLLREDEITGFERTLIEDLERRGYPLRNIAITSMPKGQSDFDDLMDADLQERFIHDPDFTYPGNARNMDENISKKNNKRFQKLLYAPYGQKVIQMVAHYVRSCIPAYLSSEMSFWSVSCLPQYGVHARVNIFWQEVFNLHTFDGALWCSMFMCRSPIAEKFGNGARGAAKFRRKFSGVDIGAHRYGPGGQDQINIFATHLGFTELLNDPVVITAIRLFNLRLMKKGPNNFARSHCFALMDRVLAEKCLNRLPAERAKPAVRNTMRILLPAERAISRWRREAESEQARTWKSR